MEEFRKVGLATCTALVLANMIGTGVFTSLGFQVAVLSSPFLILMLWTLGGVVALCGAMSYAELAAALPRSGGEYHFLTKAYHPSVGFMGGFVSISVGFAAPIALAAMAFGKYFAAAVPGTPSGAVSMTVVLLLAAVHALTVKASGRFQLVITGMKITLIAVFIGIGFVKGFQSPADFTPRADFLREAVSGPFAVSLVFVLYSYSGWNAAAYIINEVRNPQETVPRALILATLGVTVLYVALNAVFLGSGPMRDFADRIEVGEIAARNLLGVRGGQIMSGLIAAGLVSAISAMTWAGPRVAQTVGQDFPALGFLARTSPGGVPRSALLLQTALVVVMLATSTFEAVLVFAQFAILTCSFLTVLGVIVLRVRRPELNRPFRCPWYPVPPLVFLALNLLALVHTAGAEPRKAAAGLGTLGLGIGLYFLIRRGKILP